MNNTFEIKTFLPIFLSFIAIIISVTSFYFTNKHNKFQRRMVSDEKLFSELGKILERAFNNIEDNNSVTSETKKWRNSARYLTQYKELRKALNTDIYKSICDETEEYYRSKFHMLLSSDSKKNLLPNYQEKHSLNYKAIAIVLEFTHRKSWVNDPLNKIDIADFIKNNNLFSNAYTFKNFLKAHHPEDYEDIITKIGENT